MQGRSIAGAILRGLGTLGEYLIASQQILVSNTESAKLKYID